MQQKLAPRLQGVAFRFPHRLPPPACAPALPPLQVQAWELLGDSRELQVLPTVAAPGTLWDALQSMVGKAALAGAAGWEGVLGHASLCCSRPGSSSSAGLRPTTASLLSLQT